MKHLAISILLLFGISTAIAAQTTTYTIVGGPYTDGYYPPYLYTFSILLNGTGNWINWVAGSTNGEWACGNGKPSQGGFIFKTVNGSAQPCANSVTYTPSGTLTINGCTGPAQAVETFDDGSVLTVYWTYVKGGRWHNVCQGKVVGGNLKTAP
jgi:hypothetical protein